MSDGSLSSVDVQEGTGSFSAWRDIGPRNEFVPFPREALEGSIVDRFEDQAAAHADRLAVKDGGQCLSYDALNRKVNRIAHAILEQRGDGEESVALLLEHGTPGIVGMLAALKARKIYVPLDPEYPSERIRYILEDSQAGLVVTSGGLLPTVKEAVPAGTPVLNIDEVDGASSDGNPGLSVAPDAFATVMYTSGSTGRPKGVVSTHFRALHSRWRGSNALHTCPDDRFAFLSSYAFGASRGSVYGALLNGAAVVTYDIRRDGLSGLAGWLLHEGITLFGAVPTMFRNFAATLTGDEGFPKLRVITLSGETVLRSDVELYRRFFSDDCVLRLCLAATEVGVVTRIFLDKTCPIPDEIMPAGYPVEGTEILIWDEEGKDVGFDREGEIVIHSEYLSTGYWRKPELTAEKFLPDPDGGPARFCRTGDMGRLSPDGCLYHLGRRDFMVKIRGYRVELRAVEAALSAHPGVHQAVAVAREDEPGTKRLVGYVTANGQTPPTAGEVKAFLRDSMPHYMVPSAVVVLDSFPLTAGGKADRRALPAPDPSASVSQTEYAEPADMLERQLAQIWEKVLGVEMVGVEDDFFDVGGESLLAAKVFTEIEQLFGRKLPLATLFEAPTVRKLAGVLRQEGWAEIRSPLVRIKPSGSRAPFFCVAATDGLCYLHLGRLAEADQPFYALHLLGLVDLDDPRIDVRALASDYVKAIRSVQPEGPYFVGGMCSGGAVAFEMAQQLTRSGEEIGLLVLLDTPMPSRWWPPRGAYRIGHRAAKHARTWWHLGAREKFTYGFSKARSLAGKLVPALRPANGGSGAGAVTTTYWSTIFGAYGQTLPDYDPEPYDGRIAMLMAADTRMGIFSDPRQAWRRVVRGETETHLIPGEHSAMLRDPNVRILADKLNACLATAHGVAR